MKGMSNAVIPIKRLDMFTKSNSVLMGCLNGSLEYRNGEPYATISYTLCAGRDATADRITMSAPISGSQGFKFAMFRAFEAKLNARLKAHRPIVWHADSSAGATFVMHESVTLGGSTYGALALGGKL